MSNYTIDGWEKLKGDHQILDLSFNSIGVNVSTAHISDAISSRSNRFKRIDAYIMWFTISHTSKGTSNVLLLELYINKDDGECELKVHESTTLQCHHWFNLTTYTDEFRSPLLFLAWIVELLNKQHRYYT
jgi:hypothetical protein